MPKIKIKTLIGSTIIILIFSLIILAFLFLTFPQFTATIIGSSYKREHILILISLVAFIIVLLGWIIEKLFILSGKTGFYIQWNKNKQQLNNNSTSKIEFSDSQDSPLIDVRLFKEIIKLRYGRFWRQKIKLFLVQGEDSDIQNAIPELKNEGWQEQDSLVLIYGGTTRAPLNKDILISLKEICPRQPLDGFILVSDLNSLSTQHLMLQTQYENLLRNQQQVSFDLRWRLPTWLWFIEKQQWLDESIDLPPIGTIFNTRDTAKQAISAIHQLIVPLHERGIKTLLATPHQAWLLRLSIQLQQKQISNIHVLLEHIMQRYTSLRLQGVIFSAEQSHSISQTHALGTSPIWRQFFTQKSGYKAQKIGWYSQYSAKLSLIIVMLFWGVGVAISLIANQSAIRHAQNTALITTNIKKPFNERLKNQLQLQELITHLQFHQAHGTPWYTRFGVNKNNQIVTRLWLLYAYNHRLLLQTATQNKLEQRLKEYIAFPPASHARQQRKDDIYNVLKLYLMLSSTSHIDKNWISHNFTSIWPERENISTTEWQSMAPQLLQFWAENLPSQPQWLLTPDLTLVNNIRKILLKKLGQKNAEAGLYQTMLTQFANNWPDLALVNLVGDTDVQLLFSTTQVIPGMFTRQAWEAQVKSAIDEIVDTRRNEVDWVLTDKTYTLTHDLSPEALRKRLTERYFADFGHHWLTMLNSIQWHQANSLSEVITQLETLADTRQSPFLALIKTLTWQGETGKPSTHLKETLLQSATNLIDNNKQSKPIITKNSAVKPPLDNVFGPIIELMDGKDGTAKNGHLSFQSWLARVTQIRLKLQQINNAPDPQSMAKMLAQTVFQGKTIDLTNTLDYSQLVAASLGQEWASFGHTLFVQPLEQAWQQILSPAINGLNQRWQTTIVAQWNNAFAGRYPFKATGSDASLPLLAQFLRSDSGRIHQFIKTNLSGIIQKEGHRWTITPSINQGLIINPEFIQAINQLADISDIVFTQEDAQIRFELMARPSRGVAHLQLQLDGQKLDYFNQMQGWKSFIWPGESYYPGVTLNWQSIHSSMQIFANYQGNWGLIRLLEQAKITPLDSSRYQLTWKTPTNEILQLILRSELENGPLILLKLQQFRLPEKIFLNSAKFSF